MGDKKKSRSSGSAFNFNKRTLQEDRELANLLDVSAALSAEHESAKILELILEKATENTNSDGGSIYLVERIKQDSIGGARASFVPMLRFSHAINRRIKIPIKSKLLPINKESIAGYVATTGRSVRVRDAYTLPKDCEFKFNSEVDKISHYRTKSVLAVPIRTSKGRILGVVQLVNKRRSWRRREDVPPEPNIIVSPDEHDIVAFSDHDDKLMAAFASHAAVALENAKLTEDISNLFESFVKASVMAIEARDPTTSGHSDRVAELTVKFAEVIDGVTTGPLRDIKFTSDQLREIRYASLLHDFGKIGVRENVLLKAKKLFPHELETIFLRLQTITSMNEAKVWRYCSEQLVEQIKTKLTHDPEAELGKAIWSVDTFKRQIEKIRKGILLANESQILDKDFDIDRLMADIDKMSRELGQKILDENDVIRLGVRRGTLSPEERRQIESHVTHTFEFLSRIAWTEQLAAVPEIAHAHHEKLDGSGYPRRLRADQIPVQSRLMTISDIYDALTAFDRPYKKAVDIVRALDILHEEAREGKLDKELLKVFVEARVFEVSLPGTDKKKKAG
ncbi:MAG: GAF domain-containing protein [Oligoflexia bacterium]|nr:GAF domain-containing protein [Oligoflexia bacterium]